MRDEVDQKLTPRSSLRRPRPATPSSPRSVASFTPRTPSPRRSVSEAESYAFSLRAVEDENRALKQALAKREGELQFVQMKYADEACKLTAVQRQLKELTEANRHLSDANCQSESWASALISELEQFRSGNQNGASVMASESDMSLLDDFAEMEIASGDRKKNSPRASPKRADTVSVMLEQSSNDLAVNGNIPNGHPEKVPDIWELVMHKNGSSGKSVDTILEEIRHALDQKTIPTKREDSDVSYDRSEVEKVVRDLIEELVSVIGTFAEGNVATSRPPLITDKSELCSRLEHLVQVCHDLLHGKVALEKFVDEVCLILKCTLSQYLSNQDESYIVYSNTSNSDEGKLQVQSTQKVSITMSTHGSEPAAALDIQQEARDEPIRSAEGQVRASDQEKLDKEWVLGPDDDILPGRKSAYCEIASPVSEASVEDLVAQEEEQLAVNPDILASTDKLAECQETITILNKQLQALRTPATHKPQSLGTWKHPCPRVRRRNGSRISWCIKTSAVQERTGRVLRYTGKEPTTCAECYYR